MQGIPKTYKFEKCHDVIEFFNIMKNNNAELINYLTSFHKLEFSSGEMLLIYKNDILIGYLCIAPFNYIISTFTQNLQIYQHWKSIGKYDDNSFKYSSNKINSYLQIFYDVIKQLNSNSYDILDIALLEIIKEHRSFNTVKVVFNYIKQYCIDNDFDFAWCSAKNESAARLYQMAGFKCLNPINGKQLNMFLDVKQKDYYEVTERLKNKYKKNLFENMKDTKKLYESIMASVAKQVKKAINEGEYADEVDIQGDTERWCDIIDEYLWDRSSADVNTTLALFATLVYLNQLADEEIKDIAKCIMEQIDSDGEFDNPPVDEVFFEAVAERIKDSAEDWCADVVRDWKLNQ